MEIRRLKKEIKKEIKLSSNIYIVGHNNLDLDAVGAMLGLSLLSKKYGKKVFFIIDDKSLEKGVSKVFNKLSNDINIIKSNKLELHDLKNDLLLIVDTNKNDLISCSNLLSYFRKVLVIDHHNTDNHTIKMVDKYIFDNVSSTCEVVTELLKMFFVEIPSYYATVLLSGIVLDTNSFVIKTTKRTFYNAYFLLSNQASPIEVQYLLKQDIKKFINREKMLANVKIIDKKIAIAKGSNKEHYKREDLAKVAETLLLFNDIETSFVIGKLDNNEVGISARTLTSKHIGNLMKKLNGGGNSNQGATKFSDKSINEVEKLLIAVLKN